MTNFDKLFKTLMEDNVAGGIGSVFSNGNVDIGNTGNSLTNTDSYAPGDMRVPKVLGAKKRKGKTKIPLQRRTFTRF